MPKPKTAPRSNFQNTRAYRSLEPKKESTKQSLKSSQLKFQFINKAAQESKQYSPQQTHVITDGLEEGAAEVSENPDIVDIVKEDVAFPPRKSDIYFPEKPIKFVNTMRKTNIKYPYGYKKKSLTKHENEDLTFVNDPSEDLNSMANVKYRRNAQSHYMSKRIPA